MKNLSEFRRRYGTDDQCLEAVVEVYKQNNVTIQCDRCSRSGFSSFHRYRGKRCYTCACGSYHWYPTKGTLFQDSSLAIKLWFEAMFWMVQKSNIKAVEMKRRLSINYSTAWKVTHLLRAVYPNRIPAKRDHTKIFRSMLHNAIWLPVDTQARLRATADKHKMLEPRINRLLDV